MHFLAPNLDLGNAQSAILRMLSENIAKQREMLFA